MSQTYENRPDSSFIKGETDPHGLDAHQAGAKLDSGKLRIGLVLGGFARALREVSRVGTFGANKYSPNGWKSVPNGIERYTDALGRHLLDEAKGEAIDNESGILHAAHAAWNSLARLELMIQKMEYEEDCWKAHDIGG